MTKVIVVGHGMVGSRFVEELLARDPEHRFEVTVLGAEEYEPYNRVLLSEVVAGKVDVTAITLPRGGRARARVLAGTAALTIDRARREVLDSAGDTHPYDALVLATGAAARIPDVPGLDPLPAGVHGLRSLDDAREIVATTHNVRHAVVVGAGVLGVEVATGLRARGLEVTVLHRGPVAMDRQLDPAAGGVLARELDRLGIALLTGAHLEAVESSSGHVTAVRTSAGTIDGVGLLVLTAGTVPERGLAVGAGLEVAQGIVVGQGLATTRDPHVFAIGDCAQPPGGATGLVAQGWDQARRLAAELTDEAAAAPLPAGGTDVVRVKAVGLDVVTMGVSGTRREQIPGARTVALSDPEGGRHVEVVVADGRVVGATCVGAGQVASDLVAAYTRASPAPSDPAQLLLRPVANSPTPAASPTLMPARTTVCQCNGVTKGDIVECWHDGATSVEEVAQATRATTGCGGCKEVVCGLLDWLAKADPEGARTGSRAPAAEPHSAPSDGVSERFPGGNDAGNTTKHALRSVTETSGPRTRNTASLP
ncbi:MAG: NAD(P)/FAD-dependent oxidoreductase [Actinomycetales bacterium]|nr:NAD(P)/FAD-dependent oxidoreductase [Actinomycetales bacterium]